MKGPASLESLGPELFPVLPFSNGIENDYLQGTLHFVSGGVLASGAGVASFRLRNPSGSNVIAIVESVCVTQGTIAGSSLVSSGPTALDLGGVGLAGVGLDARDRRASTCFFSSLNTGTQLSLGNAIGNIFIPVNAISTEFIQHQDQEVPILPGDAYQWSGAVATASPVVFIRWRERFLEDSERT